MNALALTDYGNMFGVLEFYFQCMEKGIKPIIGCEMYYVDNHLDRTKMQSDAFRNPMRGYKTIVLLAQNETGYKNLCYINTLSYQKGFYFVPRADYNILNQHKEGLIAFTGGERGRVSDLFYNKGKDYAVQEINKLQKIFGKDLYLEFHSLGVKNHKKYNSFLAEVSQSQNIPVVASNDVHYVKKKDHIVQDVLFCIGSNRTLSDMERSRLGLPEFYFKDIDQMRNMYNQEDIAPLYQQACDNTLAISDQCSIHFKVKDKSGNPIYHLPKLTRKKTTTELGLLAEQGLEKRFQESALRSEIISDQQKQTYRERLKYELKIIKGMGFNGYFFIVQDFIRWAKDHNIPVGPGRGSGASSLVSYSLGITDLDPMPLNLIFERFLNPDRISMPDFDIDFCQENRHKVIQYINEKYGTDCTSHVITYGRLNVRAAIRDVGRVLGLSYSDVDVIAKLIPNILGITLKEALKKEPKLKALSEEDPQVEELLLLTGMLEGLIRHVGIHAAGIIIADTPIVEYAPLYKGPDNENVIQYDLKHAEKLGLVKFDFLGLKTLTHIEATFQLIKKNQGKEISTQSISLKDPGIYKVMCSGDTVGVFQFEGFGITDLLIKAQPTCFEDIVAINALYRPGPMNMIPDYLDRKKGNVPVDYIFSQLKSILKETYGIIVYQEQVQQIAVEIAGYSYGEADVLRRAMGKKIHSEMAKQKDRFLKGAKQRKYNSEKAEKLFDLMAEFAKYGFNKSHAAAYCVLACQTAWLKNYYPLEFFASQLTIDQNDSDKLDVYIKDVKRHNIQIVSPHINTSFSRFSIKDKKIYFSIGAIKGVGDIAAKNIEESRELLPNKKFETLEEFFEKIDLKKSNKKTLESLIKAGALDGFGYNRREIYENIEYFIKHSSKIKEEKILGQQSLFDTQLQEEKKVKINSISPWSDKDKLFFEKEVFGFYLNNHPMETLKGLEQSLSCEKVRNLETSQKVEQSIQTLGMIKNLKEVMVKKNNKIMAFFNLEDESSSIEAMMFSDTYKKYKKLFFENNEIMYFKGFLKKERLNTNRFIVEEICLLDDFLKKSVKTVQIRLNPEMKREDLNELKDILMNSKKGDSRLFLEAYIPQEKALVKLNALDPPHDIEITFNLLKKMYKVLKTNRGISLKR